MGFNGKCGATALAVKPAPGAARLARPKAGDVAAAAVCMAAPAPARRPRGDGAYRSFRRLDGRVSPRLERARWPIRNCKNSGETVWSALAHQQRVLRTSCGLAGPIQRALRGQLLANDLRVRPIHDLRVGRDATVGMNDMMGILPVAGGDILRQRHLGHVGY